MAEAGSLEVEEWPLTHRRDPICSPAQRGKWEREEQRRERALPDTAGRGGIQACDDAGHASNPYNNCCDELAVAESRKFK